MVETVAAAWWPRRLVPDVRVRVVNVVDLMRLFTSGCWASPSIGQIVGRVWPWPQLGAVAQAERLSECR